VAGMSRMSLIIGQQATKATAKTMKVSTETADATESADSDSWPVRTVAWKTVPEATSITAWTDEGRVEADAVGVVRRNKSGAMAVVKSARMWRTEQRVAGNRV
jgi:hypothetical protein